MLIWTIFVVVSVAVLGVALVAFRGTASRRNRASEVWSETEVDYKARDDLIPNLEETLKMYAFPQREGPPEAPAGLVAPSAKDVAVPGLAGWRGDPQQVPRGDNLAEAS
jgi:hypothetical protein